MIKNKEKQIDLKWDILFKGNWNFRDSSSPIYTKPITVVNLDGDEFVWKHEDIMELIRAYHLADKKAIEMIQAGQSGNVKNAEVCFLDKVIKFVKELKDADNVIKDDKFLKNGQKALRIEE